MAVTAKAFLNSLTTMELNPSLLISYYENELEKVEGVANELKSKISFLKKKMRNNNTVEISDFNMKLANIKWRSEIRKCITPSDPNQFYIATSTQIAQCISYNNELEIINRDIKGKISSTLSLMWKEGEIGRCGSENGKDYYYGIAKFFEPNKSMTNLKKEYEERLGELFDDKK
jgi:hypothetical protein